MDILLSLAGISNNSSKQTEGESTFLKALGEVNPQLVEDFIKDKTAFYENKKLENIKLVEENNKAGKYSSKLEYLKALEEVEKDCKYYINLIDKTEKPQIEQLEGWCAKHKFIFKHDLSLPLTNYKNDYIKSPEKKVLLKVCNGVCKYNKWKQAAKNKQIEWIWFDKSLNKTYFKQNSIVDSENPQYWTNDYLVKDNKIISGKIVLQIIKF